MAALLITPSAAARVWTNSLPAMLALAASFAGVAAVMGTYISSVLPKMPTAHGWSLFWRFLVSHRYCLRPNEDGFLNKEELRLTNEKRFARMSLSYSFSKKSREDCPLFCLLKKYRE